MFVYLFGLLALWSKIVSVLRLSILLDVFVCCRRCCCCCCSLTTTNSPKTKPKPTRCWNRSQVFSPLVRNWFTFPTATNIWNISNFFENCDDDNCMRTLFGLTLQAGKRNRSVYRQHHSSTNQRVVSFSIWNDSVKFALLWYRSSQIKTA